MKSVSPLLDGFTIGTPVNDHYGVCCYPAVKEDSDRKYIVKVISIPASQTQLDALLITGAYKDPAEADDYFHSLANGIVEEAEFLEKMSHLQGFLPFEGTQIELMRKNRIGYNVYLLSGFRLSLERYMHRQKITHLEAVNLGIDLCAALAACRREGMLYIALKPANIYISTKKEYKIGDLGFVPMYALKFSSMPEKYRSCYTAPELLDDLSVLNETVDTYAVGMILYQLFNNGLLPGDPASAFPAPANADAEMAAIILKACSPNPAERWQDPSEMEQALIAYMQANIINNTPIMNPINGSVLGKTGPSAFETTRFPIPVPAAEVPNEQPEAPDSETVEVVPEAELVIPDVPEAPEDVLPKVSEDVVEEVPPQETAPQEVPLAEMPAEEAVPAEAEPEEAKPVSAPAVISSSDGVAEKIEAAAAAEFAALTGMDDSGDATPMFLDSDHLDNELEQMNRLLRTSPTPKKQPKKHPNIEPVVIHHEKKKSPVIRFLLILLVLSLLTACGFWGYIFYQNEYLRTVDAISITGSNDEMTVTVDSDISDSLLTVVCTDAYGHATRQRVRDGKATFQQLSPDSMYKVQVEITGVHKLVGHTSDIFNTESVTNVVSFTASVGNEDGSVMLNLIVDGHEPDQWQVIYTAEGEPELGHTFSGHTTTINNLTLGKPYTFRLETAKHQAVNGQTSVTFTAGRVIVARDVRIVSCNDGILSVQWDSNLGEAAENWIVHCYGGGYDQVIECNDYQASFTGIDTTRAYTVEVSAKGMSQISRVSISANPITLTDFRVDDSNPQELTLSWDFDGTAPSGGWLVQYTLDGGNLPSVLKSNDSSIVILPRIPGATYHFSVQATDNVSVFNGVHSFACPATSPYSDHGMANGTISFKMLQTPEDENWSFYSVLSSAFTNSFLVNQPISLVLNCNVNFYLDSVPVNILYVFRDAYGNALTELVAEDQMNWHDMWVREDYHYAELNVPTSPSKPGNYTLDVYIDGYSVGSASLSVF